MSDEYTVAQFVSAMWNAGLRARHDFNPNGYQRLLEGYLEKHMDLHPYLREVAALLIEEEDWMPSIATVRKRLQVLRGEHAPATAPSKERTQDDDLTRTARGRIPYRAERDTDEYREWMISRLTSIHSGKLKARSAADLIRIADRKVLGRDLEAAPF